MGLISAMHAQLGGVRLRGAGRAAVVVQPYGTLQGELPGTKHRPFAYGTVSCLANRMGNWESI